MITDIFADSLSRAILIASIPAAIAAVAQSGLAIVTVWSTRDIEKRRKRGELAREAKPVIEGLRCELQKQRKSWRELNDECYAKGENEERFVNAVNERLGSLDGLVEALKDCREYLDPKTFHLILEAATLYEEALEPVYTAWPSFSVPNATWTEAASIFDVAEYLFSVADGVLKLTNEYLFAEVGDRKASKVYCEQVKKKCFINPPVQRKNNWHGEKVIQ